MHRTTGTALYCPTALKAAPLESKIHRTIDAYRTAALNIHMLGAHRVQENW